MSIFTIVKKYYNSFVVFISINCKVLERSSRHETILEKLKGKKGS
jgi:hypothetical protein